jgi:triacylglycerol lipase
MSNPNWFSTFEFDANSVQYSGKNAFALGQMSLLAYYKKEEMQRVLKAWGFTHFRFFDKNPVQAFLAADAEKIIVAFRGSDSLKDWLNNFDLDLIGGPFGGKVHEGFSDGLSLIWKDIQLTIDALKPKTRVTKTAMDQNEIQVEKAPSVWFTGHSLGAAFATLATARFREKDVPIHGLYTYGSPRIGDRIFSDRFNADFRSKMFRFVNKNDLVTRVPIRALFYSHVGQLFYFDDKNDLHTDPSFWYRFVDGIQVRIQDIADLDLSTFESHLIVEYLKALEKNKQKTLDALNLK